MQNPEINNHEGTIHL